jgi:hypothetical protein
MYAIQENELDQLRDLGSFLDIELNFFAQALELLQEVKAGWTDEAHISLPNRPRPTGPSHSFVRSAEDVLRTPRGAGDDASDSDEDRGRESGSTSRRPSRKGSSFSLPGRKSSARRRADSTATERGDNGERDDKDGDKDKDKKEKRRSLAGWGMSWGKSSGKGKDKFSGLKDGSRESDEDSGDDTRSHRSARSTRSNGTPATKSPKIKSSGGPTLARMSSGRLRETTSSATGNKKVVALYDYAERAEDELSFSQGQEIVVLQEVSDDWWLGTFGGKQGVFPVAYVRVISVGTPAPPILPARPPATKDNGDIAGKWLDFPTSPAHRIASESEDSDHPFGDHYLVAPRQPDAGFGYGYTGVPGGFDRDSIISGASASDADSNDEERLVLGRRSPSPDAWDREREREKAERAKSGTSTPSSWRATPLVQGGTPPVLPVRTLSAKKTPPPPPPRKPSSATASLSSASASSVNVGGTPPIPPRPAPSRSGSSYKGAGLGASVGRAPEVHESPFD